MVFRDCRWLPVDFMVTMVIGDCTQLLVFSHGYVLQIYSFLPASLSHQHNTDNHAKPLITIKPL